ncbi:MAG: DNA-3-methyladenine glycosylase family protein [Acidimicrobiales bacterium]
MPVSGIARCAPSRRPGSDDDPQIRHLLCPGPLDLRRTLSPASIGRRDPTTRYVAAGHQAGWWRATNTPDGPATTHISDRPAGDEPESGDDTDAWAQEPAAGRTPSGRSPVDPPAPEVRPTATLVTMRAWGPGAGWCLARLPGLVGEVHPPPPALGGHPLVVELVRRFAGVRLCRTEAVFEAMVVAVLGQKVVAADAKAAFAQFTVQLGRPAPGPLTGLICPPTPAALSAAPSWRFHRAGVERRRADTVRVAAAYAHRIDEVVNLVPDAARARLLALPNVGPWTVAETLRVALGDPDALSVGDYHLPNRVAWALAGEPRADDDRMLALLAPWMGRRAEVARLIEAGGPTPPRFGPRLERSTIARI